MKKLGFATVLFICVAGGIFGGIPGLPLRVAQELLIVMGAMLFISLYAIKNPWVKTFAVWNIARTIVFVNDPSYFSLVTTTFMLILLDSFARSLTISRLKATLDVIGAVVVLHSINVIWQYSGLWISFVPTQVPFSPRDWIQIAPDSVFAVSVFRFVSSPGYGLYGLDLLGLAGLSGTTGNINVASALIALGFPALMRRKWWILIPPALMALYITRSWNGILPVLIVCVVYSFFKVKHKYLRYAVIAFIIAAGCLYFYKHETFSVITSMGSRLDAWKTYLIQIFPVRWIEGWGVGQSPYLARIVSEYVPGTSAWRHPHCEYINVLVEVGIIGFIIVAGYLFTQLRTLIKLFRRYDTAFIVLLGVLSGLINAGFSFTLHTASGMVFLLFLGMMQYINSNGGEKNENGNWI